MVEAQARLEYSVEHMRNLERCLQGPERTDFGPLMVWSVEEARFGYARLNSHTDALPMTVAYPPTKATNLPRQQSGAASSHGLPTVCSPHGLLHQLIRPCSIIVIRKQWSSPVAIHKQALHQKATIERLTRGHRARVLHGGGKSKFTRGPRDFVD